MNLSSTNAPTRHWPLLAGFAVCVFLAAELSRQLSAGISDMSAVWPPIGLAVGAALVLGGRVVPVYAAVMCAWFLHAGYGLTLALAVAVQESLMVLALMWVLRRGLKKNRLLGSLSDTLRFYGYGTLVVLVPASLFIAVIVRELGYFREFFFVEVFLVYWLSESLGMMLFAPVSQQVIQALAQGRRPPALTLRSVAYIALLAGLVLCNYALLASGQYLYGKVLTYFYFPLMAWVAISRERWLAPGSLALVGILVPGFVVVSPSSLEEPGLALLESVIVVFVVTIMTQLVQAVSRERQALLRRFEDQAQRDLLTGLRNDRGLINDMTRRRHRAKPAHERLVVVELCNYDEAYDLLDEAFSIRLEKFVAEEVRLSFTQQPMVARLGVGQFGLYWRGTDLSQFQQGLSALLERLNGRTYVEPGALYRMFIAVGCIEMSVVDEEGRALSAARQIAGLASGARDYPVLNCTLSDPRVQGRKNGLVMLEELKESLSSDRLVLFAQEIQGAQGPREGLSFEVLIRMKGRDGQIVSPAEFLPVAEQYGLMGDVDRWVVAAVHEWARRFPHILPRLEKCAINLSGMTLADPGFLDWLRDMRQGSPLAAEQVCFEVTETQMIGDWEQAANLLGALREEGYRVSLDDFGTGLATFEYLTRFPFDYLKIDGRFVRDINASAVDQSIVRAITDVATTMRLETIAEFVGDAQTRDCVAALGVDYVQGYAIARPMPLSELMTRLADQVA